MIEWGGDSAQPDKARLLATIWMPDGLPDYAQVGTVYTTPEHGPLGAEAKHCARAVAQWLTDPDHTAGTMLLAELAERGITPDELCVVRTTHSDTYDVTVQLGRSTYGRLSIADRSGSVSHVPAAHTGWSILLHDERGEAVGDPVYIAGDGGLVDCAQDSAIAATFVAGCVKNPVLRHCDCYAQDRHDPRHDHECHLYAIPRVHVTAARPAGT